jgi:hypothetical protein
LRKQDLEIAVHHRAEPADHHGGHGVAAVGVGPAQGVCVAHGDEVVDAGDALGPGHLARPVGLAQVERVRQGAPSHWREVSWFCSLELDEDLVPLGDARGVVVHDLDHPDLRALLVPLHVGQAPQVAHHAGVGVVLELLVAVVPGPALAHAQDQLVLVHAVPVLVADELVRVAVLEELDHVVLAHAALLDVLAGGVQEGGRGLR